MYSNYYETAKFVIVLGNFQTYRIGKTVPPHIFTKKKTVLLKFLMKYKTERF